MNNHEWAETFVPQMIAILKTYPPFKNCIIKSLTGSDSDLKDNVDMIVSFPGSFSNIRICCRVRCYEVYEHYFNDLALRYKLQSGKKTEWQKWHQGDGDIYLYCFTSKDETKIIYARLINLKFLRELNSIYENLVKPTMDDKFNLLNKGLGNFFELKPEIFKAIKLTNLPTTNQYHDNLILYEWPNKRLKIKENYYSEEWAKELEENESKIKIIENPKTEIRNIDIKNFELVI
jgi:hypothetical protein